MCPEGGHWERIVIGAMLQVLSKALWPHRLICTWTTISSIRVFWEWTIFNSSNGWLKVTQTNAIWLYQTATLVVGLELENWTRCQILVTNPSRQPTSSMSQQEGNASNKYSSSPRVSFSNWTSDMDDNTAESRELGSWLDQWGACIQLIPHLAEVGCSCLFILETYMYVLNVKKLILEKRYVISTSQEWQMSPSTMNQIQCFERCQLTGKCERMWIYLELYNINSGTYHYRVG